MIEQLNKIAEVWWNWMWPMFWQVSVLIVLIGVADFALRKRFWPQVRYSLWLLVLVKLILPPTFSLSTGIVSQMRPWAEQAITKQASSGKVPAVTNLHEDLAVANQLFNASAVPVAISQKTKEADVIARPNEITAPAGIVKPSWQVYVMLAWLLGLVLLASWLIARFRQLRVMHCGKVDEANLPLWLEESLAETAKKLKLKRLPQIVLSKSVACPAVFGIFRPVLLLPKENMTQVSRKDAKHILLHELAHIKRGDLWVHGLYMVLQLIYWFNPLLWLVRRKLQHLRELCCDATVARILREKTADYRETILQTAKWLLTKPKISGIGILGLVERPSRLLARLYWLEKKTWRYQKMKSLTVITVAVLMIAFVLPMAKAGKPEKTDAASNIEHQQKSTKPLHRAAAAGDAEQVKSLISKGADVNEKDKNGLTPLHSAAWNGRKDVAEVLIAKGANVNATDALGQTPLHLFAHFEDGGMGELLIAKGANINARDNKGNTPLLYGAVKLLIDKGAAVNTRNNQDQTPLHLVAARTKSKYPRNLRDATFLLANGADVNAKDKNGCTPLYVAAGSSQRDIVELLLSKGALINETTDDGLTALHRAAMLGETEIVELLLRWMRRRNSALDSKDMRGCTPLHYAARAGNNDIVELIIRYDALVNAENVRNETPAHLAVVQNHKDTVKLLISKGAGVFSIHLAAYIGDLDKVKSFIEKGISVNAEDGYGLTPLHAAAGTGQKEVAEFLIGKGATVNADAVAEGPGTPLHYAIDGGSKEVAELLVSKGARVNERNKDGETSLHLAAKRGYKEIAKLLLASKSDVNAKAQDGCTPLHYAARSGHKDIVALLIDNGADVNVESMNKSKPLNLAADTEHKDVVNLLIDRGTNISKVDEVDLLYYACMHGHRELAELLIKKGANVNTEAEAWEEEAPSLYAVWHNHPDVLKLLLDHGANPDAKDRWDWSLLHYTVDSLCRSLDMTRMLLDKGANPNAKVTADDSTPFYWAVGYGLKETVELFIAKGADVNAKKNNGNTPLHEAASAENLEIVELLIAKGADIDAKNKWGLTPLYIANDRGHDEIVELLRKRGAKE